MKKYILPILVALAVATILALAEERVAEAPTQAPIAKTSISTDGIRVILDILDSENIGSIMHIGFHTSGRISVLSEAKLKEASPTDGGAYYEFENIEGKWTLIEKGHIGTH